MYSRKLALLALACASQSSFALERAHDGSGQAVLLPFYTALHGESSVFSVTNHSDSAKAVRVVIAEGANGRPALTFNVYLAPRDSWSGAITATSNTFATPPQLLTQDASCTSAPIPATGVLLRTDAFSGSYEDYPGGSKTLRLHQGQIEFIELATLTGSAMQEATTGACDTLRARFATGGSWAMNPNTDVSAPSGQLSGALHVIDVADGVAFDIDAVVFDHFSGAARLGNGVSDFNAVRIHKPTLPIGQAEFVVDGVGHVSATAPADAVSLSLMATRLEGDFLLNDSVEGQTRWAVSFPTRAAYVDNLPGGELTAGSALRAPFASGSYMGGVLSCFTVSWETIDRTGHVSPPADKPVCGQVSLFNIGAGDGGDAPPPSSHFVGVVQEGRLRLSIDPIHALTYSTGNGSGNATAHGLPVVASSLMRANNKNARPGVLASYAITGRTVRTRD